MRKGAPKRRPLFICLGSTNVKNASYFVDVPSIFSGVIGRSRIRTPMAS
jgi:hypothetical protein